MYNCHDTRIGKRTCRRGRSKETQGKGVTCTVWVSTPWNKRRHKWVVLWKRNPDGTGTGSRAGSWIYDCICKILLKGIGKKLCDSRWEEKTEEFPGIPKDLWGVRMWSMSFGLLYRKLWSWWPFSALKIYECVISKIALKISLKRLYLPFVSFIINWKDITLQKSFLFSVLYSNFFLVFI